MTRRALAWIFALALPALEAACDVKRSAADTGGIDAETSEGGACPRGLVVFNSDYQSTNVSLLALDGRVLSPSFVSSGSTATGLSAPLSGDVVPPLGRASGDEIVLIDRYPASVLSWVDLKSAAVRAQLRVSSGVETNPHDYAQLSATKAYVPRFSKNANDVLIVDPSVPKILGSIDMVPAMQGASEYLPNADRAIVVGGRLYVLLSGYTSDFKASASSRLVAIDVERDVIEQVLVLSDLHGCSGLAVSPDRQRVAISCAGEWAGNNVPTLAGSGLAIVELGAALHEVARYPAAQFGEGPAGFGISYSSARSLAFTTFGRLASSGVSAADDTLIELNLESGESDVVLRSAGPAFTLGDVRCASECAVCFVTDAGRNGVHRYSVRDGKLMDDKVVRVDTQIGLPPRYLGEY